MAVTLKDYFILHGKATGKPRIVKPFHNLMFRKVTECALGRLPSGAQNLAICIPPRHTKTFTGRDAVSFFLGMFPDANFILTSYSQDLATENLIAIRNAIQEEWNEKLFGKLFDKSCLSKADQFTTIQGGKVYAASVTASLTGFGAGLKRDTFGGFILIDDPLKASNARSETERENVNRWFTETLLSRRNSDKTPIILIMQRLHKYDLIHHLKEHYKSEWEFLEIPALDENNNPLWPETISYETLMKLKEIDPATFWAQYMQEPIIEGGNLIKSKWFKYYERLPTIRRVFITADTAQKTKEANDFTCFSAWATDFTNVYHLDSWLGKWEAPELRRKAIEFWEHTKKICPSLMPNAMYVEDKISGTGLIQELTRESAIPVIGIKRHKDKVLRTLDILPYIESGRVFLFQGAKYGVNPQLLGECEAFSKDMSHKHDDFVDTLIDALVQSIAGQAISVYDVL